MGLEDVLDHIPKTQIPLSGFVWFVKEEGSPAEALKSSTEGQGEELGAAWMESVHMRTHGN